MVKVIRLNPSMVRDFVNAASKCDFDIDVAANTRYYIDAKSILGVMALDLSKPITLYYDGYNVEFEEFLKKTAQAC